MIRRTFLATGAAAALTGCETLGGAPNVLGDLRNLVEAFAHVAHLLGSLVGISAEQVERVRRLIEEALRLVDTIVDVMTAEGRSTAQRVLQLVMQVLDILAPVASGSPPFDAVIAAAIIMVPLIARWLGIVLPTPLTATAEAEKRYRHLTPHAAEATLAKYATS